MSKHQKFALTRVTFANIPSTASRRDIQRGYNLAMEGTHILLTAEDHMRDVEDFVDQNIFHSFQDRGGQTGRCSVHLRRSVFGNTGKHTTVLLNRANGMKFPGATRYACQVRGAVDLRSGRKFNPSSMHLVPHADEESHPGIITHMPRGKANVRPAIRSIAEKVLPNTVGNELGGIDANIHLDADLRIHDDGMVEQLRRAGLVTDVETLGNVPNTHGQRNEYDWLFARFVKGVHWVNHGTLPRLPGLDHRFRWGTFSSPVRPGWPGA